MAYRLQVSILLRLQLPLFCGSSSRCSNSQAETESGAETNREVIRVLGASVSLQQLTQARVLQHNHSAVVPRKIDVLLLFVAFLSQPLKGQAVCQNQGPQHPDDLRQLQQLASQLRLGLSAHWVQGPQCLTDQRRLKQFSA